MHRPSLQRNSSALQPAGGRPQTDRQTRAHAGQTAQGRRGRASFINGVDQTSLCVIKNQIKTAKTAVKLFIYF